MGPSASGPGPHSVEYNGMTSIGKLVQILKLDAWFEEDKSFENVYFFLSKIKR